MTPVYLSPAHTEKSQVCYKPSFVSESASLLSDCEALSLLKKASHAVSADNCKSFSKAFFFSVWENEEGQHPWVSSDVLAVLPYVLVLHLNQTNCVIYLPDDFIKHHTDSEKLPKQLFLR